MKRREGDRKREAGREAVRRGERDKAQKKQNNDFDHRKPGTDNIEPNCSVANYVRNDKPRLTRWTKIGKQKEAYNRLEYGER